MPREPLRDPPRVGSTWRKVGVSQDAFAVVAEVDRLAGTEGRYLVQMTFFEDPVALSPPRWYKDEEFAKEFRRNWTRYDMIREGSVFDDDD